jgi:hypothetical protein
VRPDVSGVAEGCKVLLGAVPRSGALLASECGAARLVSAASIGPDASGVVGGHAVIAGPAAAVLLRVLGDARREFVRLGLPASDFMALDEALSALHEAANAATSRAGTGEVTGKPEASTTEAWISTQQVADAAGRSARWIRTLHATGRLEGIDHGGRLMFPPETVERVRTLREAP